MADLPPPPPRPARGRRYSMSIVRLARQMYGDGDAWTPIQIKRYLREQHGLQVSENTVRYWVVPGEGEAHREANRRRYHERRARRKDANPTPPKSDTPVLDRMRQLHEAGVNHSAIAAVLRVDMGLKLNRDNVRYYLRNAREPELPKRRAA